MAATLLGLLGLEGAVAEPGRKEPDEIGALDSTSEEESMSRPVELHGAGKLVSRLCREVISFMMQPWLLGVWKCCGAASSIASLLSMAVRRAFSNKATCSSCGRGC